MICNSNQGIKKVETNPRENNDFDIEIQSSDIQRYKISNRVSNHANVNLNFIQWVQKHLLKQLLRRLFLE